MAVLETKQMVLRQVDLSDAEALLAIFIDSKAMRFYPAAKNDADARAWIQKQRDSYQRHGHGMWLATLKEGGDVAGLCGLIALEAAGDREVELGYVFQRCLWGRGLAVEAAQACWNYGVSSFGYTRLVTRIGPASVAARRVAESLGMALEKQIVQDNTPFAVYALARQ